jgi:hypothetical protein
MTDAPKTLALDSAEWKALVLDNIARAHAAVTASGNITPEGLALFSQHLDRIKGIAGAWHASLPKAQPAPQDEPVTAPATANGNGAAPVKRRGGWQKGRPRKPRADGASVQ